LALIVRRGCRVQWKRTRRHWLSRLRKPRAIRAASLIIRFTLVWSGLPGWLFDLRVLVGDM